MTNTPCIDVFYFPQWHAQPYPEQALSKGRDASTKKLQQRSFIRAFIVLQNLVERNVCQSLSLLIQQNSSYLKVRQSLTIESQSHAFLHRVIYVEIFHAQNVLVDIELA